jgi:two-component system phosphate regulon sensor histidine kinase PhoR
VKLFFTYLLKTILAGILIVILANHNVKTNNLKIFTDMLTLNAKTLSHHITQNYVDKNFSEIDKFAKESIKKSGIRITLINKDGSVLADSFKNPLEMENHLNRDEVLIALENNYGASVRKSESLNEILLYTALPIYENNDKAAVLRLSMPVKNVSVFSYEFISKNYFILFIIFLISIAISFILARSVGKKTLELTNAFKELSLGNFNIKTHVTSEDELGELSDTFNDMSDQMQKLFHQISSGKEELNEIIASVSDAIMVIEKQGMIVLTNKTFDKQFDFDGNKKTHYKLIFKDETLANRIENYSQEESFLYENASKYFSCTIAYLKENGGHVVVFHDITDIKILENFKKDLIGNVSHELKTPLSLIKIYLELLENEQDKKEFKAHLETVNRNVERLSNIIDDLLTLSELEAKKILDISEFNISDLFDEMKILFKEKAANKNIALEFKTEKNISLKADKFRLEQALSNVISNSLRYTEKGNVRVCARISGNNLVIEVKDSGIGIPKKHLAHVFKRFYVVDKSRSRKTGGTGLGLSIVKHIVALHSGIVKIESVVAKGTEVSIRIPFG